MRIGLRLFFAFFVITGITAFFLLRVFMAEVQPSVREVMEDLMVDTAHLLAELAEEPLAGMPAGGQLEGTSFAAHVRDYALRPVDARIWGLRKTTLDLRVLVTDEKGRVVLDTVGPGVGQDYSRWNDVLRTLRGEYGARLSREVQTDDRSGVMFVAAPVLHEGRTIGVVSVAKPLVAVEGFIGRAQRRIFWAGVLLLSLSLAIGVAVTLWLVWSVRRLRDYARRVQLGQRERVPQMPGELGDLAQAMGAMRERLDGREHIERTVRALTHELKSPLAAIRASGELLQDELTTPDRERFAGQVVAQSERMQALIERMLELAKLEMQSGPPHPGPVRLDDLAAQQLDALQQRIAQAEIEVRWLAREPVVLQGDAELQALALSNLLVNALDFAPAGSAIEIAVQQGRFTLRDFGPGVPEAAWPHLGERFFSTARPGTLAKGSGLGLALVRQVAQLHGARLSFERAEPGLRVVLDFGLDFTLASQTSSSPHPGS
ncbi:two-component system sensor histidine kinase CreC [Burkholderiaceae bacterium UC74_6]